MKLNKKDRKSEDLNLSTKITPKYLLDADGEDDLGLDSDHSSNAEYQRLNGDNEMISYGVSDKDKPGKLRRGNDEGPIMRK